MNLLKRLILFLTVPMAFLCIFSCERGIFPENEEEGNNSQEPLKEILYVGQCKTVAFNVNMEGCTIESDDIFVESSKTVNSNGVTTVVVELVALNQGNGVINVLNGDRIVMRVPFNAILPVIVPDKKTYELESSNRTTGVEVNYFLQTEDGYDIAWCQEYEEGKFLKEICETRLKVKIGTTGSESVAQGIMYDTQKEKLVCLNEIKEDRTYAKAIKFFYSYQDDPSRYVYSDVKMTVGEKLPLYFNVEISGNDSDMNYVFYSEEDYPDENFMELRIHLSSELDSTAVLLNRSVSGTARFNDIDADTCLFITNSPEQAVSLMKENSIRLFFVSAPLQVGEYHLVKDGSNMNYDPYVADGDHPHLDGYLLSDCLTPEDIKPIMQNGKLIAYKMDLKLSLKKNPAFDNSIWRGPVIKECKVIQNEDDGRYETIRFVLGNTLNKEFGFHIKYDYLFKPMWNTPVVDFPKEFKFTFTMYNDSDDFCIGKVERVKSQYPYIRNIIVTLTYGKRTYTANF